MIPLLHKKKKTSIKQKRKFRKQKRQMVIIKTKTIFFQTLQLNEKNKLSPSTPPISRPQQITPKQYLLQKTT